MFEESKEPQQPPRKRSAKAFKNKLNVQVSAKKEPKPLESQREPKVSNFKMIAFQQNLLKP